MTFIYGTRIAETRQHCRLWWMLWVFITAQKHVFSQNVFSGKLLLWKKTKMCFFWLCLFLQQFVLWHHVAVIVLITGTLLVVVGTVWVTGCLWQAWSSVCSQYSSNNSTRPAQCVASVNKSESLSAAAFELPITAQHCQPSTSDDGPTSQV